MFEDFFSFFFTSKKEFATFQVTLVLVFIHLVTLKRRRERRRRIDDDDVNDVNDDDDLFVSFSSRLCPRRFRVVGDAVAVSYTHLTLPTIYSV